MAFDNSCTKAVLSASPGPTPKRCEPQLFLAALGQVIHCLKALDLGSFNMQFHHDWPKDKKNYSSFTFFAWKLRKISLDWALWCASRGIDNFSLLQQAVDLGSLSMQFQQDWPKNKKNYSSFPFFAWKLRKISLDWALWCASRGIDNFSLPQLHQR